MKLFTGECPSLRLEAFSASHFSANWYARHPLGGQEEIHPFKGFISLLYLSKLSLHLLSLFLDLSHGDSSTQNSYPF